MPHAAVAIPASLINEVGDIVFMNPPFLNLARHHAINGKATATKA